MSSERRGLLLILSSPSGAGKSTICRRLLADFPQLQTSVSVTTRAPRPGEVDGVHYNFLDRAGFDARVKAGDFLEWAEVHENRYGTPKAPVEAAIEAGRDVLFDIDWQGARDIARQMPTDTVRVFVLPPSMAELARRLHTRAEDAADVIERRLQRARGEIAMWGDYDYVIVNDALEQAYSDVVAIYRAERMKRSRNPWVAQRVAGLISEN